MQHFADNIPNEFLDYLSPQGRIDFHQGLGREHYMILCALSFQIQNGIIIDIGTNRGNSMVCLGYPLFSKEKDHSLHTFDIHNFMDSECINFANKYNVNVHYDNLFDESTREKFRYLLLKSQMIMIDIDPHNGILEFEMYEWLKQNDYKGIIIYDDIYLKKGHAVDGFDTTTNDMVEFWNKIPNEYKIDLTHVGHWSGTGLVSFNLHYYFKASHNSTSPLEKS